MTFVRQASVQGEERVRPVTLNRRSGKQAAETRSNGASQIKMKIEVFRCRSVPDSGRQNEPTLAEEG